MKPGEIDPRVAAIDIGLLQGKKVLDIGCNSGVFTIQLACHYLPQSILGVDIDNALVNKAKKNVKYWMRRLDCDEAVANIIKFEGGNYLDDHFLVNETYDVIMWYVSVLYRCTNSLTFRIQVLVLQNGFNLTLGTME